MANPPTAFLVASLLAAALLTIDRVTAAPGNVDPSFDSGSGIDASVNAIAIQPDGKVLVGGTFHTVRGAARRGIARLNADGSLDPTFDAGIGPNGYVRCLAIQPDGKTLAAGSFTSLNGTNRTGLIRLNQNGSRDEAFDPILQTSGAQLEVYAMSLQADGKILIGGNFTSVNGTTREKIARLTDSGGLDSWFTPPVVVGDVYLLGLRPDGRIIIGGEFTMVGGTSRVRIAGLQSDGSLDTSFNPGTGISGSMGRSFWSLAIQTNGQIVVGGAFGAVNNVTRNGLARLNPNGSLDSSFSPSAHGQVKAVVIQSDGAILIGGYFTSINGTNRNDIARLTSAGQLDTTFDPGSGPGNYNNSVPSVACIAVQPDGRAMLGGSFGAFNGTNSSCIARVHSNGNLDNTFSHPTSGLDGYIRCVAVQPDAKVLIGGWFSTVGGIVRKNLARLNRDGSLDPTFAPTSGPDGTVDAIVVQPDGKIIASGYFRNCNGVARFKIARFHADGSLDAGFDPGSAFFLDGCYCEIISMVLQPDGKILLAGVFGLTNGAALNVTRINGNGSRDGLFPSGQIFDSVHAVARFPDGRLLICGNFTTVAGTSRKFVARLSSNGALDNSFQPNIAPDFTVRSVAVQPDGKALLGGSFISVNGTYRPSIARVNGDGTLDTNFAASLQLVGSPVESIALQPDGKILINVSVSSMNGKSHNSIARLNTDGSLDESFDPGSGADLTVYSIALAANGQVLIGGSMHVVDGAPRWGVARLFGDVPTLSAFSLGQNLLLSWPTNFPGYALQSASLGQPLNWMDVTNTPFPREDTFSVTNSISGTGQWYRLRGL